MYNTNKYILKEKKSFHFLNGLLSFSEISPNFNCKTGNSIDNLSIPDQENTAKIAVFKSKYSFLDGFVYFLSGTLFSMRSTYSYCILTEPKSLIVPSEVEENKNIPKKKK
jgi:hypothetical protein